jgi:putative ABC transport system permease protein
MAVAIAALAFLNALLFRPFPIVTKQDRLVRVRMSSPADYAMLQEGLTGLQSLAAYALGDLAIALPEARSIRGALTSANYFDVLGVRLAIGRAFDATDANTHAAVAVISYSSWTREFGGDPSVIGRSIRVADDVVQIVGVAPEHFVGIDLRPARPGGGRGLDVWLPIWMADRVLPLTRAEQRRQVRDIYFVGRLKDNVDVTHVQAEAEVVALRLAAVRGQESPAAAAPRLEVSGAPASAAEAGRRRPALANVHRLMMGNPDQWHFAVMLLLPIPILVLVIACVNAANLMLARGSQRHREIAIRLAIGAGRARIIRQLLIESAVLALFATAVAVPIASWGLQMANTPLGVPIPVDSTVLALTVLTAAGTTVAFGLAPAVRVSAQRPSSALGAEGARSDAMPRQSRMRRLVVIAQAALSLGLLATAWQLVATVRSQAVSGGTPADRLLIARFDLRPLKAPAGDAESFYSKLVDGARRLPGVEAAGVARHTSVWTFGQGAAPGSIVVWHPTDAPEAGRVTIGGYAGGDLFEALGLRVLYGRGFTDGDRHSRPQVAVVNQTFAEMLNGPAVGSVLRVAARDWDFGSSIDVRIVGIIEPTVEPRYSPGERPAPKVYLPWPIEPEPALALYLRTRTTAATVAQPVRELVSRIGPRVPILELGTLDDLNERSFGPQLWLARSAAFLGVIGLLLATAGLYGVSSYVVALRSREIAIRMAVGATPRTILAMVLRQSMRVVVIGLLLGGGAAVVASRLIQAGYHGIEGIDGAAFGAAATLFVAAMLVASAVPAVRASRLDPVENLKGG